MNFLHRSRGTLFRFFTYEEVEVFCRYFVCNFRVQATEGRSNDANAPVIIPQLARTGPVIDGDQESTRKILDDLFPLSEESVFSINQRSGKLILIQFVYPGKIASEIWKPPE